jgi:UDP-N-acetylglucosamine--N-acetylmuramyl-(pentapeptide) pyrophosphoryl-undecaprenol N-acetylglucosamine transferase
MQRNFLIAAGGTGGHLYPGIAVADELRRRDPAVRIVFAGTARGLETRIVPRSGYALELLPILPLNGVGLARLLLGLLALPWGLFRSALLLRRVRPHAVLGVGGYAGGPLVLVAALLGVRTVILEPNAIPGFTNRVLRPFVRVAACAWEEAMAFYGTKGVLTGNPVRGGFAALPDKESAALASLLVFGGSQGSRVLNEALVAALPQLPGPERLRIVHQTGTAAQEAVASAYGQAGREAEVRPYLDDMESRFAQADLVVSRSGATTCAELQAAGRPAVLVPFAKATDDHQRRNAQAMAAKGAAVMLEEKDLASLGPVLTGLLADPTRLAAAGRAARAMARPDAAARVADLLEGVA